MEKPLFDNHRIKQPDQINIIRAIDIKNILIPNTPQTLMSV